MRLYSILFPGQEPQNVHALYLLIKQYRIIKRTFEESSEYIRYDLNKLIKNNLQRKINKSKYNKFIALTSSIAIYRLWKHNNKINPHILAGHSLGEYSALICSESLAFQDAIKLIVFRDKFMRESMENKLGAMHVIIGLKQSDIEKILKDLKNIKTVSIACINTQHQIVISGEKYAVHKVSTACKKLGAKKIFHLSIYPPSHCILMKSAAKKFSMILNETSFQKPIFPVVNNVDTKCEISASAIRSALTRQLYNPVKWINTIIYLANQNTSIFVETGLNNTLTNLNKFIVAIPSISFNNQINSLKNF
ncbi:MAG: acyltransferase domain-containing protein [Buchnera aphidicola (Meitanaphis microgallis)]